MSSPKYAGTGRVFWEKELSNGTTITIKDDGDEDNYIFILLNGEALARKSCPARRELGDEQFEAELNEDSSSNSDSAQIGDVAFKCDDCNRTWPAKEKIETDDGDEICPPCEEVRSA